MTVFHLHIPKTGGQTFAAAVSGALAPSATWVGDNEINDENFDETLSSKELHKKVFVSTHFSGTCLSSISDFDFTCLIREPIAHIMSNVAHILREPRNDLHAVVSKLSLIEAVKSLSGWFSNTQSRYLVNAFTKRTGLNILKREDRWLAEHVFRAADRVRLLGPTTHLHELADLILLEHGVPPSLQRLSLNVAPVTQRNEWADLKDWLLNNKEYYSVDTILYNEANLRYADYKARIHKKIASRMSKDVTEAASKIYSSPIGEVYLGNGWCQRHEFSDGVCHYAGPTPDSYIGVDALGATRLEFCIPFLAGVEIHEIQCFDAESGEQIASETSLNNNLFRMKIPLANHSGRNKILLRSPRIYPLCKFNNDWNNSKTPVAFAAADWMLA